MRLLIAAAVIASGIAATMTLPPSAWAQTQAPTQGQGALSQDELRQRCNTLTIIEGLSGDDKSMLMTDCMAGNVALPEVSAWQDHYQACADEGRFSQSLRGQELINYIETCLKTPAAMSGSSTPPTASSWTERRRSCTDQGKFEKGLRGNDLIGFIDQCMSQ